MCVRLAAACGPVCGPETKCDRRVSDEVPVCVERVLRVCVLSQRVVRTKSDKASERAALRRNCRSETALLQQQCSSNAAVMHGNAAVLHGNAAVLQRTGVMVSRQTVTGYVYI